MYNILIFPAGTEIGLEIYHSLSDCKDIKLFIAGQDTSNHAQYFDQPYHIIPMVSDSKWVETLNQICIENKIDFIFPAHDEVIYELSRNSSDIYSRIVSSPPASCELLRFKSKTYERLKNLIQVPKTYSSISEIDKYPVFVKPDRGQGSNGARRIDDEVELKEYLHAKNGILISEYLPGDEYTIDCFSDRDSGLLFSSARTRERIRNGIAVNTATIKLDQAESMARIISNALNLYGAWFFQVKRSINGELTLLEVASRIAGSMAIHRVQGVNFALLSIYEQLRIPIKLLTNSHNIHLDRALGNRFRHDINFDCLYIDMDDTLITNGHINLSALTLIAQCINKKIKIVLITKHKNDPLTTLSKLRLCGLFDEIIHISSSEEKSKYITASNAIFVDDSFSERMLVAKEVGIPTFDLSMLELLTNSTSFNVD